MKTPAFITALLLTAVMASAQQTFPGLKSVLSAAEWKRAGLDRLSPDEIGVIDAALIRHQSGATAQLQTELTAARSIATAVAVEQKKGLLQRFGLPVFDDADWRTLPPLKAKFVKWEGGNRFKLDNGQVWEGFEPITYDLVGKEIEIHARPMGQFALVVDGVNTTLRVMRLR
ncbi:MAG: hypothetical protein PSU94_11935 [Lacunisphaera sp.]|nr:hypothetical protein [Lacunisphaera sp.]